MRIAVLGLGGVGGTVAGALAGVKEELILIARGATKEAVQRDGLLLESETLGRRVVRPALLSDDPEEIGQVDVLFLCCKGYGLRAACERYRGIVGQDTLVIPLLNGVTAARDAAAFLENRGKVVEGFIYCYSHIVEPGHISNVGTLLRMGFGFADGSRDDTAEYVRQLLREGGMSVSDGKEILTEMWEKYLMMCGNSAAFLRFNCAVGGIQREPERMEYLRGIYRELQSIGIAFGASLPDSLLESYLEQFALLDPDAVSSLYRDIRERKPETELEVVIGAGCRLAEEKGMQAPLLREAYEKWR